MCNFERTCNNNILINSGWKEERLTERHVSISLELDLVECIPLIRVTVEFTA
jgi:hypothetical protein